MSKRFTLLSGLVFTLTAGAVAAVVGIPVKDAIPDGYIFDCGNSQLTVYKTTHLMNPLDADSLSKIKIEQKGATPENPKHVLALAMTQADGPSKVSYKFSVPVLGDHWTQSGMTHYAVSIDQGIDDENLVTLRRQTYLGGELKNNERQTCKLTSAPREKVR